MPDGSYGKFASDATDDVIRSQVEKDFPSAYKPAAQPGAIQQKKGGPVLNAKNLVPTDFEKNPQAVNTFDQESDKQPGLLDSLTQPQQDDPAYIRALKGPLRVARGLVETPFKLLAPPQTPEESMIGNSSPTNPGAGPAALAVKRGIVDPAISAGSKAK